MESYIDNLRKVIIKGTFQHGLLYHICFQLATQAVDIEDRLDGHLLIDSI